MLVYDITNEKSFDNIKNWIRNIEEVLYIYGTGNLSSWPFRAHPQPSSCSTLQQTWKGWSSGTNATSMTSGRCPKTEERRWWSALRIANSKKRFSITYSGFLFLSFAFSWRLIMESSLWRLVQRQTSMWRKWVCVVALFTAERYVKFDSYIYLHSSRCSCKVH